MTQSFGPSRAKLAAAMLATAYLSWAAVDDFLHLKHNRHEVAVEFLLAAVAAGALGWLLSLKLTISSKGVEYRSVFRSQSFEWETIREIYYTRGARTAYFLIPLWRTCRFVLVATTGERMVFGSRFRHGSFAGTKVILCTTQTLFNRAAERFNRGQEVSFGPVRISRRGIWTDGWNKGSYAWSEVQDLEAEAGGLFLRLSGGRTAGGRGLGQVANLDVLRYLFMVIRALLEKNAPLELPIYGRSQEAAHPSVPPRVSTPAAQGCN